MRSLRHYQARIRFSHRRQYAAIRWVGRRVGALHPAAALALAGLIALLLLLDRHGL
jgi:hypothetical protein